MDYNFLVAAEAVFKFGYNNFMRYRKVELKDVWAVIWRLIVFVVIEIILTTYLLEKGLIFWWVVILLVLLVGLINWHCRYFGYECSKCGYKQKMDLKRIFLSLNFGGKKYLKCKKCGKWNMAKLLVYKIK